MTTYGETEAGFVRKLPTQIEDDIKRKLRRDIHAKLKLDGTDPLGNALLAFADEVGLVWELLEIARNGFDPNNAEGPLAQALALLSGHTPRAPTKGSVAVTINLNANKTFAAGSLVAQVGDDTENLWANRDPAVSTTAGNYAATYVAATGGAFEAPVGTLKISTPVSGWNSITNSVAATPGSAQETTEELMIRRANSLQLPGTASTGALKADLNEVENVLDAAVFENDLDEAVGALPAHSLRAVIWDSGGAANPDEIAEVLYTKSAGVTAIGSVYGTVTTGAGYLKQIYYDLATQVTPHLALTVLAPNGVDEDGLKASLAAAHAQKIGADVIINLMKGKATQFEGVIDVTAAALGTVDPPTADANLVVDDDEVAILTVDNIDITVETE